MCSNRPTMASARRSDRTRPLPHAVAFLPLVRAATIRLAGVALIGCGAPATPPAPPAAAVADAGADAPNEVPAPSPAVEAGAVEVALVDHAGLMAAVEARRGKVVVLDCWSTSCPPCVKEFPGLVALAEAHPDGVACLSLSFDYEGIGTPEEVLPPVRAFLTSVGAGRVVNMLTREDADAMYRKLQLDSVPAVYVWARDGSLAQRFDDDDAKKRLGRPFTYEDVAEAVRGLLEP